MKILLAVDGSKSALGAAKLLVEHADWYKTPPRIELVNVQYPLPKLPFMNKVVSKAEIRQYYRDEGEAALRDAVKLLDRAGLRYEARLLVGEPAETLLKHAKASQCEMIVVGNRGRTAAGNVLVGSIATKVLHFSPVPVLLVR